MVKEEYSLESELKKIHWTVPEDHLKAGRNIYYGDIRYPGKVVRETPEGVRTLIEVVGTELREIKAL